MKMKVCNKNLMVAHCKQLFDGSLPVFVAASINNAVHQLIFIFNYHGDCKDNYNQKCDNLTPNVIGLNLLYAIISHISGYFFIIYLNGKLHSSNESNRPQTDSNAIHPQRTAFHRYCSNVSLENSSFAWRQSLSLIVLSWLDSSGSGSVDKGIVVLQWILSLVAIVSVVIVLFYLRKFIVVKKNQNKWCYKSTLSDFSSAIRNTINEELMRFDSEAFSLALASSFTIILIVFVYPQKDSNYLTIMDDTGGAGSSGYDDDAYTAVNKSQKAKGSGGKNNSISGLFVLYAISLTVLLTIAQIYGNRYYYYHHYFIWFIKKLNFDQYFSKFKGEGRYNSVNSGGFQLVESDQFDNPLEEEFDVDDNQDQNLNHQLAFDNHNGNNDGIRYSSGGGSRSEKNKSSTSANSLYKAICHLSLTTMAYLVVCAWYSWSVISFQSYFSIINEGTVLGLFLFAVIITLLMLILLLLFTQVAAKYQINEVADGLGEESDYVNPIVSHKPLDYIIEPDTFAVDEEFSVDKTEEVQWLLITSRFLVGWAFANFIGLSISKIMTSIVSNANLLWLNTLEKVLVTIIVFSFGALIESNRN